MHPIRNFLYRKLFIIAYQSFDLERSSLGVIFANTNIPENRFKILHFQQEINESPDESEDIFQKNMFDRYMDRPDEKFQNGKLVSLHSLCYAEFLRYYYVSNISNKNDWQSLDFTDDMLETNIALTSHYPSAFSLMSSSEQLKCQKIPSVFEIFYTK